MSDEMKRFLQELSALTNKHGFEIGGCGCSGSPFVIGCNGKYYGDNLQYDPLEKMYKLDEHAPLPDPPLWTKENPCTPSGNPCTPSGNPCTPSGNPCTPSGNPNPNINLNIPLNIPNGGTPQGMGMILGAAMKGIECESE